MPTTEEIKAHQLIRRVAEGDMDAFTALFEDNYDRIYVIAYAYCKEIDLAKDITQQVFIKTWERSKELAAMESPLGWMCNTAKFLIINTLKQQSASHEYLDRWWSRTQTLEKNPSAILDEKLLTEKIHTAINQLPDRQREVYRLSREEGLTYEQIAHHLQIGRETVKEHMSRALKAIRLALAKDDIKIWLMILMQIYFSD